MASSHITGEHKMGHELVCNYRDYTVYFDNGTATYWSIAGGGFQTLTEALQCIDRVHGDAR